jgi:putative ABC transport system permease protein
MEAILISILGIALGLTLAHLGFLSMGALVDELRSINLFFLPEELSIVAGSLALGVLAGLIPAILAFRTDISTTLAKG